MQVNPHALRVIRERSGLSISELARRAGLSQPHLSNLEAGRRRASPGVVRRLADALQVPLLALVPDDIDASGDAEADAPGSGADEDGRRAFRVRSPTRTRTATGRLRAALPTRTPTPHPIAHVVERTTPCVPS